MRELPKLFSGTSLESSSIVFYEDNLGCIPAKVIFRCFTKQLVHQRRQVWKFWNQSHGHSVRNLSYCQSYRTYRKLAWKFHFKNHNTKALNLEMPPTENVTNILKYGLLFIETGRKTPTDPQTKQIIFLQRRSVKRPLLYHKTKSST